MNDTIKEQLSAYVDGELPDEERELLQRRLLADGELQSSWQRYHLIRDAMRSELPDYIPRNHEAITLNDDTQDVPGDRLHATASAGAAISLQRFARPAAGFAIAASVAMLAVVGVLYNKDSLGPQQAPQIATSKPVKQSLPDNYIIVPRTGWESAKPAVVSHLNSYLVDHSNYSGFGASQSIIPYSRVAGYDQPMPDKTLEENAPADEK